LLLDLFASTSHICSMYWGNKKTSNKHGD
jgi:hypothetical protein